MYLLAWRQLQFERLRTVLTAASLGAVIAVIMVLEGFEQGQYYQLEQTVLNRQATLIAAQSGVTNFIAVRSSIPQLARAEVEAVEGVSIAHPLTAIPIIYSKNNIRTPVYVIVYDTKGGPSSIISGQKLQNGRDIIIDYSLAKKHNIKVGDQFQVTDFEFTVAGITRESAFMMPFAFINYDGMIDLFIESQIAPDLSTFPLLSYLLIDLAPGTNPDKVAQLIEKQVPSVDVMTSKYLAKSDVNLGRVFFEPIMGLLVTIGYVIGMLVVGLIMYVDVNSRKKNFAVLKALGFSTNKLFIAVAMQSLLLLTIAIPIGVILAQMLTLFIHTVTPVYMIRLYEPFTFVQTLVAGIGFAVIGAFIPLKSIARSDPMLAFQEA